jgi:hypothetical protein
MRLPLLMLLPTLAACGGPHDRSLDIVSTTPTGHFSGTGWTMAKSSVTKSGTNLSVALFSDSSVADCATSSNTPSLIFSVPAMVAKRQLQLSFDFTDPDNQTVTFFVPPSDNNIATDGIINVSAVSDTSVTMGLLANGGTGFDINGTFTSNVCP